MLLERGGSPSTMVEIGGSGESVEGHGRRYFGGDKGTATAGVWKTRQEQGRVRGGENGEQRVVASPGTSV